VKENRRIIYIAGPFRSKTSWGIEQNVRRAEEAGFEILRLGGFPLIPHANTRFFHGSFEDEIFLEGTLELLRRADAILLLSDWKKSDGARHEHKMAVVWGKVVLYSLQDAKKYLSEVV
jgi:hypothetical protein